MPQFPGTFEKAGIVVLRDPKNFPEFISTVPGTKKLSKQRSINVKRVNDGKYRSGSVYYLSENGRHGSYYFKAFQQFSYRNRTVGFCYVNTAGFGYCPSIRQIRLVGIPCILHSYRFGGRILYERIKHKGRNRDLYYRNICYFGGQSGSVFNRYIYKAITSWILN